jgi:hypothetical protein
MHIMLVYIVVLSQFPLGNPLNVNNSPPDTNRLKEDLPVLITVIHDFRIRCVLVNGPVEEDFKQRQFSNALKSAIQSDPKMTSPFPELVNISKVPKLQKFASTFDPLFHGLSSTVPLDSKLGTALLSFSADMQISVNRLSHSFMIQQCGNQVVQNQMLKSTHSGNSDAPSCRPLIACVRTFNGLGFLYSALLGIFTGANTLLLSPFDYFVNPQLFFDAIHKYKVKDAFATYPMMEWAISSMQVSDYRTFSLHNLTNLMLMTDTRSRPEIG